MNESKPPLLILIPFMLMGIIMLVFACYSTYTSSINTKDYVTVEGKFVGSSIYSSDSDGTTYSLTYSYIVDNKSYSIYTNYGTSSVPEIGSTKTIKYNPYDPEEAILTGLGGNGLLFFLGIMFFGIPMIIIFESAIIVGIVFTLVGIGAYYMMCSSTDSLSLIEAFKINGLWIIIPILFIVVGVWAIISQLFAKKSKIIVLRVEKIEHNGMEGKYEILFSDDKISENSFLRITGKYFIYETDSENKFTEGKKYIINLYKYGIMFGCKPISDLIQARVLKSFTDEDFIEGGSNE
jgi:hypothetical protein